MSIDFGNTELTELTPRIAVIGVGGAGCNAVNNMISAQLQGVDFIVANTDAQALANAHADNRIQLGVEITQGLGAGAQPKIGEAAAEEALERIDEVLAGCHMAFVTAGMGGGTGTGAAPVIARRAREKGILTVGVVTKPFQFEGGRRMKIAEAGIQELASNVDTLIIIPNQNLFRVANERTTFADAFNMADEVLHSGVRGITDLMVMPGLINLDFADVRTVMSEMGKAMMGTGEAEGESRASDAAAAAISNPLLEEASLKGAKGVIINVTGGMDMTLFEVDEAVNMVRDQVDTDALIVFGSAFNQDLEGKLRVSVVATGIEGSGAMLPVPEPIRSKSEEQAVNEVTAEAEQSMDVDGVDVDGAETDHLHHDAEVHSEGRENDAETQPVSTLDLPTFSGDTEPSPAPEENPDDEGEEEDPTKTIHQEDITGPGTEAVKNALDDLEAKALKHQGDNLFVAEAPMAPKVSMSDATKTAKANEDAYVSDMADRQERAIEKAETVNEDTQPQKRSLFQLMTSSLRSQDVEKPSVVTPPPASNDSGETKTDNHKSSLGGLTAEDRSAPAAKSEQLEIPSFLRRQQN